TASAHIITTVIGSGVLSLAWAIAQLGWVVGPAVHLLSHHPFHLHPARRRLPPGSALRHGPVREPGRRHRRLRQLSFPY
ncbi:unnamed protein product, partial [Linum tenue]